MTVDPLTVACPRRHCGAVAGEMCMILAPDWSADDPSTWARYWAKRPHQDRIRLAAETAAHADPMLDAWPLLGPTSPCGLCGSGLPQRHRIVDAIVDRMAAGEDREDVAGDYGLPMEAIRDLVEWDARWNLAAVR
jgi:hypothetical protein